MFQICTLASSCLSSCSTGTLCPGSEADALVKVFVWGSNSSHQLAEGTLEKILQPKLAQGFSDAQVVRSLYLYIRMVEGRKGISNLHIHAYL